MVRATCGRVVMGKLLCEALWWPSQPHNATGACLWFASLDVHGEVRGEAPPKYGPGRPRQQQPRGIKALRYGLQVTLRERAEVIARRTQEPGCFVLLTHVPPVGEMGHR